MFPKALWMKEWKHAKMVCFALFVIYLINYPIAATFMIDSWKYSGVGNESFEIQNLFSGNVFSVFSIGLIILLAGFLIGIEKNSKRHDFMMALPFSRTQQFLTKYAFGFLSIIIPYSISFALGYFVIVQSDFSYLLDYLNTFESFFTTLLGYFVIYSLAMLIGTISGEIKSQVVLTIIFLFLPQGLLMLLSVFADTHGFDANRLFELEFITKDIFWVMYVNTMMDFSLMYPLIFGILFTLLAWFSFKHTPSEHSGEFLMFPNLHPVFALGIPICGALVGGMFLSVIVPYHSGDGVKMIAYWLGFLIAIFFTWKITKRLLRW
ncbi:hypothetical protein E3U55_02565 [Filobacillus milosensis]|uniref:ABC transporter permease n=1 Tax=Filobacillus milosensis TaxID=94137 RepID=A0A4Y8IRH1_9BACI|nr:ABC transporter permease [Filobacillus milosensis]TFB24401.1 hypothetical protein E3U55_02565 [Filobacillus milosensis]